MSRFSIKDDIPVIEAQIKQTIRSQAAMSTTRGLEDWRNITGIGHGKDWCAPSKYSKDGKLWGAAMRPTPSADPSSQLEKSAPSKALDATAKSFVPCNMILKN